MSKRLFVGGLPYSVTNSQLEELFSAVGKIDSINVITDRYTGQGKGFGFVEMTSEEDAQNAIKTLNGTDFMGRKINVNEARPQESRDRNRDQQPNRW